MKVNTDIYLLAAKRTPIASFGSELASLTATDLAAEAIKATLESAGVSGPEVKETFLGNVCAAGVGQAPARQAALKAGISEKSPADKTPALLTTTCSWPRLASVNAVSAEATELESVTSQKPATAL